MNKDILIRFLNNQFSESDLDEIINWIKKDSLNKQSINWSLKDWSLYPEGNYLDNSKFTTLFDLIQNKIEYKEQKARRSEIIFKYLSKVAAILLIPVLAFLFYTLSIKQIEPSGFTNMVVDSLEVVAPLGSRTIVQLSDGSVVHLNYGSRLKYPQVFSPDKREVILSGEGYFDVAHNKDKPFVVKTKELNIKAIGTSFNVMSYPDENTVETTLVDGVVILEQFQEGIISNKTIGKLTPGQHVEYKAEKGIISSTMVDVEKYIAWKEGKIIFEDTPIEQVAEKLNRMFNVDIQVSNDAKDNIFTVTFIDEPLFQILDLMKLAAPIEYKTLPRKKLPNGTFSKQIIHINNKNK